MKALCENEKGEYEFAEAGEIQCGRDFCDACGDCLSCNGGDPCIEGNIHRWVLYNDNERNPLIKK